MSLSSVCEITGNQIKYSEENYDLSYEDDITVCEEPNIILCILYRYGKLSAAYYNFVDKQLYVYEEMIESLPEYVVTASLFREIKPKYVLSIGGRSDDFIRVISDIIMNGYSWYNTNTTSDTIKTIPENLYLVPLKEYTYEICKAIISQLNLVSMEDEPSERIRELYINSLISFDKKLPLQAIGTLVKFLEKNWSFFGISEKNDLCYIYINQIARKDQVLIDNTTFKALQIFCRRGHEATFKRGLHSSEREGLSIYKLFSVNCKSRIGLNTLKNILLNPINNIDTLNQRLDFITFVLHPRNRDFVESLRDNIQDIIGDTNVILTRIENSRAKARDWYVLYKTIYRTLFINELSSPYRKHCSLLLNLHDVISTNLIDLEESIKNSLDFNVKRKRGKPTVRYGLDEDLDAMKLRRQNIINDVMAGARFSANNLPNFLDECSVVYLPEMGHLLVIKEWSPNCQPEDLQDFGFQFMFKVQGKIHYKDPMCVELDKRLGNIISEITDHENRIIRRLSGFILKYNNDIREPLKIIGMIDSLIAMAITTSSGRYTRPLLNQQNYFELQECRHPLVEYVTEQFQSNDFYSGRRHSKIKIITGPNGSGKTVYLKQISLTVYLAHVGSYVPCASADISVLKSMHSVLMASESATTRLSSFMIDAIRISNALRDHASSSLILIDELGKGTSETDGLCCLVEALHYFVRRGSDCPHVLVSTHFQKTYSSIPKTPLILYQKMGHYNEDGVLYFLYKIMDGVSNSFAIDVAQSIGLDEESVKRAHEVYNCIMNDEPICSPKIVVSKNLASLNNPKCNKD